MRVQFLSLLVAVAFGFAPAVVIADETKKDEKACPEKKGGCCDEGAAKKEAAKKDGCCEEEAAAKAAAKKDAGCGDCKDGDAAKKKEEGCDGCGKDEKAFAKAIVCTDCKNSEKGPCEKCCTALKEGKVSFVPVSGMTCGNCEGAVANKLEKIEGVKKYAVMHRFNGIALFVEPGKTVKLSDLKTALGKGKFEIDETAKLAGQYTFKIANASDAKTAKSACEILCKLFSIENCGACAKKDYANCLTFNATGKGLSIKSVKDKLAEAKIELADIEIHGPAKTENSKS
jgi:copper chaperone CopZ